MKRLLVLLAMFCCHHAHAYDQWQWKTSATGSQVFSSKEAALAAMHAVSDLYALFTVEGDTPQEINNQWIIYRYYAPGKDAIVGDWTYRLSSTTTTFTTEEAAATTARDWSSSALTHR
jgi:hypothetical protein